MATKAEPEATLVADTSAEAPEDPPNLPNPLNPLNLLTTVASCEELSVLKCTNKEEVIAHEKQLTSCHLPLPEGTGCRTRGQAVEGNHAKADP